MPREKNCEEAVCRFQVPLEYQQMENERRHNVTQENLWFGLLVAWVVIWLWTRFQSGTMKLKYFKFWGAVPEAQRKDNLRGFGMTAALLVINVLLNIF